MRVHHVTFLSPGVFVSESTSREVPSWDTALACEMSTQIVERHNARPYAFYFTTSITAPDVPDGMGGTLKVEAREVERSGLHFLGGRVIDVETVEREEASGSAQRHYHASSVLAFNMRHNWPLVCETRNGYRHASPFGVRDVIVDPSGNVIERGDTPERIAYRARILGST